MTTYVSDRPSPFLRIQPGWRFVIVAFIVLYEWLFPTIAALGSSDATDLFLPRVLTQLVYVLLLCFPLIFYRREYGFLHPLILPTLFTVLKAVGELLPYTVIDPLQFPLFNFDVSSLSPAVSLQALSHHELAWTRLDYEAVQCLALVCLYAGYFSLRRIRPSTIRFNPPRHLGPICFGATMACALIGFVFIAARGGLTSYIVALRGGRHANLLGAGQFLVFARFAVLPVLVWFAYRPRSFLNPWWLIALAAGTLTGIVVTGSRSTFIIPLVVLLFLGWRKARRVLIVPSLLLVTLAIVVVGAFGAIRQDYGSTTVNTSVLSTSALGANVSHARAEFAKRNAEESSLAGFAGARNGLLWGRSYVGAVSFLIPRAIWPQKPFNGGAYNDGVNFQGRPIGAYNQGATHGIPLSAISEAYWNFSLPGVIVVFFLLGVFFRWLSAFVWRNAESVAALVAAVWISINFVGSSLSFVDTSRDIIFLAVLYYALGILRPRSSSRVQPRSVSSRHRSRSSTQGAS